MNEQEGRYCSSCGKELAEGMKFCPSCGKAVASKNENDKLEEREGEREEEAVPRFKPFPGNLKISPQDARQFFGDYKRYLRGIFKSGLKPWFEAHREAYMFTPTTSYNLDSLTTALQRAIMLPQPIRQDELAALREGGKIDPESSKLADKLEKLNRVPTLREKIGAEFVSEMARQIILGGLAFASEQFDWQRRYDYQKNVIKRTDLPDLSKFKKDVLDLVSSGTLFDFD